MFLNAISAVVSDESIAIIPQEKKKVQLPQVSINELPTLGSKEFVIDAS